MMERPRSGAFDELAEAFTAAAQGDGGLVAVRGGLLSGKTSLLRRFRAFAADAGAMVLTATASAAEQELRAGVLDQLFHGAGLPSEVADRVAGLVAPGVADPGQDDAVDLRTAHEFCMVLRQLSRELPVVVSVDDVHHADRTSLRCLQFLCRRLTSTRVLVVVAERRGRSVSAAPHVELTSRATTRVALDPLPVDELRDLLGATVSATTARELAPVWQRISGGNRALVAALFEDLTAGRPASQDSVGPVFARTVQECLLHLDPTTLAVARAVAVLGVDSAEALAASVAGVGEHGAGQAIDALTAAGLLIEGRFGHPATVAAVLDTVPEAMLAELHQGAAAALYRRGAPATRVAHHLTRADRMPGDWAVEVLTAAGEGALAAGDAHDAIRFLELALSTAEAGGDCPVETRLAVVRPLVRAQWRRNPAAIGVHATTLRAAACAGGLSGPEIVGVVRHALWHGEEPEAVRVLDALARTPSEVDEASGAALRVATRWCTGVGPAAAAADAIPWRRDDPWRSVADTLTTLWSPAVAEGAVDRAEQVLRSCEPGDTAPELVTTALLLLVRCGELDRAAHWCSQLVADAARAGALAWQALVEVVDADIALRRGEVVLAAALVEAAFSLLPRENWGTAVTYPLAVLIEANVALGRRRVVDELMRQPVPRGSYDTVPGLGYLRARGRGHLAARRVLAAVSDLTECGARMSARGVDLPWYAPWRGDLARANVQLGHHDVARDLLDEELALPGADDRATGLALLARAELDDPADRPAALRSAVSRLREAGDRFALAEALSSLADALAATGDHQEAAAVLREADDAARVCHSGALVMPLDRETDSDDDPQDPAVLSDSEQRVAELAGSGHTNREISQRLHITVSTVEQHLTRVYRKLGVKSRSELPPTVLTGK